MGFRSLIRLFIAIIVLTLIVVPVSARVNAAGPVIATAQTDLNIRSGPGIDFPRIGLLAANNRILLTGRSNGWYRFTFATRPIEGWVAGGSLTFEGDISSLPIINFTASAVQPCNCTCNCACSCPPGSTVGQPVAVPQQQPAQPVQIVQPQAPGTPVTAQLPQSGPVIATAFVDVIIRGGPGNQYENLGTLFAGQSIFIDGRTAGWYRFSFVNSVFKGWLPMGSVSITGDPNSLPDVTFPPQ
ncbi:MAG: SH3 domain-containing protein [Anaerolineae bacterium]|nr:SH3 domain-containing protein [Anaerolineae bacterium]